MRRTDFVLERDSTPVAVWVRGHGPGIILVPGGLQTAADFDRLGESLAGMFTTIVLDRRGRGASRNRTRQTVRPDASSVLKRYYVEARTL